MPRVESQHELTIRRRALLESHHLTEREEKNLAILELVQRHGQITRTELSQGTNLNIVTVSNYVEDLIKKGLLVERGFDVSTGGRKPVLVELNARAGFTIGIDAGPMDVTQTQMTGVITDLRGSIVHRVVRPRARENMDRVLQLSADLARELMQSTVVDAKKIQGIGVGVPGILDERAGTIRDPSRRGIRTSYLVMRDRLESEVNLPVIIGKNSTFAGYGESRLGLSRSVQNMIYLYSDISAALIFNGHVYWGSGGSVGELGVFVPSEDDYLTWIKSPSFALPNVWDLGVTAQAAKLIREGHATAIKELVQGNLEAITLDTVIQAAQAHDQLASELLEHAAMQLGIRIAYLVNLLNPEVVVIGGGIERAGSLVLEPVWRAVRRYAYEEPASLEDILPAKLGEHAVALGAACWVIREIFIQA